MPGPYQLVFNADDSKTSKPVLESKNEYLKNGEYVEKGWLLNKFSTDEQNYLPRDYAGMLLINSKGRTLTPDLLDNNASSYNAKFKEYLSSEVKEQYANQLETYYLQDHAGGIQKNLIMFSLSLPEQQGIGMVEGENIGNIYKEDDNIYIESIFTDIKVFDSSKPDVSTSIPGYIYLRCKLTNNGLQIQFLETSNKLLYQLCLGNYDVIPIEKTLEEAIAEENALAKKNTDKADKLYNPRLIYLLKFNQLAKILKTLNENLNFIKEINQQQLTTLKLADIPNLLEILADSQSELQKGFATLKDHFELPSNQASQLFKQLLDINFSILECVMSLSAEEVAQNNQLKEYLDKSLKFVNEFYNYSESRPQLSSLYSESDFLKNDQLRSANSFKDRVNKNSWLIQRGLQLDPNNELKALAANVGVDSTNYEKDSAKRALIDNYKKAHAEFLAGNIKFNQNLNLTLDSTGFGTQLNLAHSELMLDFGNWLRSKRGDKVSKNGTYFITDKDADAGLEIYVKNKLHDLVKHTLQLDTQWLDNNGYKPQQGGYDLIDGFIKDYNRDGHNGSWIFIQAGKKINSFETATDFLNSLQMQPELKRCMTYLVYQSGLIAQMQTLLCHTMRGPQGEFVDFDLTQRQIVINILENNKIHVSCKVAASVKFLQQNFMNIEDISPNAPTPTVAANLTVEVDYSNPSTPDIKTSFAVGTIKPKNSVFEYKIIPGAINPTKMEIEKLDILSPYGFYMGKFFNVDDRDIDNFTRASLQGVYQIGALGWHELSDKHNDVINEKFYAILQTDIFKKQLTTEADWRTAASSIISLANEELAKNPVEQEIKRFNYLKQIGYCIFAEIAVINIAKNNMQKESLGYITDVLTHAAQNDIPILPRIKELLSKLPSKAIKVINEKVAQRILLLANEISKNPPLLNAQLERFNYLKQISYSFLVENAVSNLFRNVEREKSLNVISQALYHAENTNTQLNSRTQELIFSVPKRMIQAVNEKQETVNPSTSTYQNYNRVAKKGLEILYKQAEQAYEEFVQAKNANNIEKIKDIFTRLRVLSTFLYETNSAFTPELMQLYSKYETLAREVVKDNKFKDVKINDKKISKKPIELERYVNIIFGYDYNGNPSPEVRFKDWICANNISRGKVSLREVLESMNYPSPLTIPYAASATNPKVKQELADLIKDLKAPLDQLDNSKQKIQSNFRNLLEANEEILPQEKREGFARLVHRTGLPRQLPKTAIRLRILSDRELVAKLEGKDLVALVKNDLTSALKTLEVSFFDGLFKTRNIKKYSGDDLVNLLIVNGGQKDIAEAVFDPKRKFFRDHYADKLSADNLASIVIKTNICDKYLSQQKFADKLLQASSNKLQELLNARLDFVKGLRDGIGNSNIKQQWTDLITATELRLAQQHSSNLPVPPIRIVENEWISDISDEDFSDLLDKSPRSEDELPNKQEHLSKTVVTPKKPILPAAVADREADIDMVESKNQSENVTEKQVTKSGFGMRGPGYSNE